jgi:hypothetical protein
VIEFEGASGPSDIDGPLDSLAAAHAATDTIQA